MHLGILSRVSFRERGACNPLGKLLPSLNLKIKVPQNASQAT